MRLLSRKIYRAYPELDRFDDEVCTRYIGRARRMGSAWTGRLLIVIGVPVSITCWFVFAWSVETFAMGLDRGRDIEVPDFLSWGTLLFVLTGFVWFPMVVGMFTRDWWMHRCIRNLLRDAVCDQCGYRLFGLPVVDEAGKRVVGCPECGSKTVLNEGHITEADINPALLTES